MFLVRGFFWLQRNLFRVVRWGIGLLLMVSAIRSPMASAPGGELDPETVFFIGIFAKVVFFSIGFFIAFSRELRAWLDRRFLRRLGIEGKAIVLRSLVPTKEKWIVRLTPEEAVFEQVLSGMRIEVPAAGAMRMLLLPQFVGKRRRILLNQQWQTIQFANPGPGLAMLRDWRLRSMVRFTPGAMSSLFWEGTGFTVCGAAGFAAVIWGSVQLSTALMERGANLAVFAEGLGVVCLILLGQGLLKLGTYFSLVRALAAGD